MRECRIYKPTHPLGGPCKCGRQLSSHDDKSAFPEENVRRETEKMNRRRA